MSASMGGANNLAENWNMARPMRNAPPAFSKPLPLSQVGDPLFSNVVLLCHCAGVNGSTTFADSSSLGIPLSAISGAAVTSNAPKFGLGSATFPNSTSQVGATAGLSNFQFHASPFTIEAWVYFPTTINGIVMGNSGAVGNRGWFLSVAGGNIGFTYSTDGLNFAPGLLGPFTPALNTWHAVAVDRDPAGNLRMYVDGAVVASSNIGNASFFASSGAFGFGNDANQDGNLTGQLDEIRVTNGVARYAGAYTPANAAFANSSATTPTVPVVVSATGLGTGGGAGMSGSAQSASGHVRMFVGPGAAGSGTLTLQWPVTPPGAIVCFADWATLAVTQGNPLTIAWTAVAPLVPSSRPLLLSYEWLVAD